MPELRLRRAVSYDSYALWLWANDQESRNASFGRTAIEWSEHVKWVHHQLESSLSLVLVGESEQGQPLGCVRFDTTDDWNIARLSYVIAPEMRGKGLSADLVRRGLEWLQGDHPNVRVRADVTAQNVKSLRVFRGLGWSEDHDDSGTHHFWLR